MLRKGQRQWHHVLGMRRACGLEVMGRCLMVLVCASSYMPPAPTQREITGNPSDKVGQEPVSSPR
jgi:hypothetical protein